MVNPYVKLQAISVGKDYKIMSNLYCLQNKFGSQLIIEIMLISNKIIIEIGIIFMSIKEQDIIDIYPRIMAYAFSKTKNKQQAEDLVQTTILRALENKEQWSNVKNLSAWLITICKNKFLDNTRKIKEDQFSEKTNESNIISNNLSDDSEVNKIFNDCSQKIAEEKRDILFMSYIKGITTKEISEIIQKPQNTILTWLANAKKELITCIEG